MGTESKGNYLSTKFIPKSFMNIAKQIVESGYEAYFVGGAIRDKLLEKEVHDFDLTVSIEPEQVKKILSDYRIIDTGIQHGTVTVLTKEGSLEITTFRKDVISNTEISDHRHPSKVIYGINLADDLARRDFTVNALALSPEGKLIDLYGGLKDLDMKLIRAVGIAEKRLDEDALRILRALRFASSLLFNIESSLKSAILTKRSLLSYLSVERIDSELSRFIKGKAAARYLIEFRAVFAEIFPYFNTLFKEHFWREFIPLLTCDFFASASLVFREDYIHKIANLDIDCEKVLLSIFNRIDDKYRYQILFFLLAFAKLYEEKDLLRDATSAILQDISTEDLSYTQGLNKLESLAGELASRAYAISMNLHGPRQRAEESKVLSENILALSPVGLFSTKKRFLKYKKYASDFKELILLKFNLFEAIKLGIASESFILETETLIDTERLRLESLLCDFYKELEENKILEINDLAIESRALIAKFNLRGKLISETLNYLQDCCLKDIKNNEEAQLFRLAEDWLNSNEY